MTQVKLLGELGEKFGTDWTSGHKSLREILKLIDCQVDGFKEYLAECHDNNVQFTVQNGEDFMDDNLDEMALSNLKDTVIITPVPAGSGKGLGKLLGGLLLLAAMFFMPGMGGLFNATGGVTGSGAISKAGFAAFDVGGAVTILGANAGTVTGLSAAQAMSAGLSVSLTTGGAAVMMLGANLAIMGLTEMAAPDGGEMVSDPSFLFNGANNNIEQGQPVPVLYGTMKIGGTPLSQGFKAGELKNTVYNLANASASAQTYYGDGNNGTSAVGGTSSGDDGTAAVMIK